MGKFRRSEKDYYYLDSTKRRWERKRHFFSPLQRGMLWQKLSQQRVARKQCHLLWSVPELSPQPGHSRGVWLLVPHTVTRLGWWAGEGESVCACLTTSSCSNVPDVLPDVPAEAAGTPPWYHQPRHKLPAPVHKLLLPCPRATLQSKAIIECTKHTIDLPTFLAGHITWSQI